MEIIESHYVNFGRLCCVLSFPFHQRNSSAVCTVELIGTEALLPQNIAKKKIQFLIENVRNIKIIHPYEFLLCAYSIACMFTSGDKLLDKIILWSLSVSQATCPKCWGTTLNRPVTETSCLSAVHPAPPSPSNQRFMEGELPLIHCIVLSPMRISQAVIIPRRMINIVLCPLHYR